MAQEILRNPLVTLPTLYEPEFATAHIAKKIRLDLNDPHVLVNDVHTNGITLSAQESLQRKSLSQRAVGKGLSHRYNVSNDEAYDLLKENHQNKIRSMLGNPSIEHSLPALRLQWPFVSRRPRIPSTSTM